jgi:hypothetical protein
MKLTVHAASDLAGRLSGIAILAGVEPDELDAVATAARLLQLQPAELLAERATVLPGFLLVLDGVIQWADNAASLPWVHPGCVAAASPLPRALRAGAHGATCLYVPLSAFLDLIDSQPSWAVAMIEAMEATGTWR